MRRQPATAHRTVLRAPWATVLLAAAAAGSVATLSVARPSSAVPLFVVHLAAVTLGAAAAYLLDDVAVAVTSSTPRSLWTRRAPALLGGLILIAAAWTVIVLLLDSRTPARSPSALTFELVALVCVAIATAAVFFRTGEAEPGNQVASVLVLVGIGAVIAQPALHVTLFTDGEPDRRAWWSAVAVAAVVVLLVASRDPASRPSLRPPAPPRPRAHR